MDKIEIECETCKKKCSFIRDDSQSTTETNYSKAVEKADMGKCYQDGYYHQWRIKINGILQNTIFNVGLDREKLKKRAESMPPYRKNYLKGLGLI